MAQQSLDEAELQSIRELLGTTLVEVQKLDSYANACQDNELKTWLQSQGKTSRQTIKQLMSMLQSASQSS